MKAKRLGHDRRFKADRRCFNYDTTIPERREKIRRCVVDRRELYIKHIRRKYE